jgi:alpha-ribazole phosphatase
MEIYLIRHTTPLIEKGICYGQTDLDVTDSFLEESNAISQHIPNTIQAIYSSPLQRCSKLAKQLFNNKSIIYSNHLKEINCGHWEMQHWDAIPKDVLDPFMNNFVHERMPNGESYLDIYQRVVNCFQQIQAQTLPAAIVAHGGVLRSILSYLTDTPLLHSFSVFKLHYGCVVKLTQHNNHWHYEILHNVEPLQAEQHKPSN